MSAIAVVGASGFVGQALCGTLRERGAEVIAITNDHNGFIASRKGCKAMTWDEAGSRGPFEVVINLAFSNRGPSFEQRRNTVGLIDRLRSLTARGGRLIHTSTLAVFGMSLDMPIHAGRVTMRRDHEYTENKILAECLIQDRFQSEKVEIVRLGNVWGPGSPHWAAGLAERLRLGLPTLAEDGVGYSNATDVRNVADYMTHLALGTGRPGVYYHHLAEFADTAWSMIIRRVAASLGYQVRMQAVGRSQSRSRFSTEIRDCLRCLNWMGMYRAIESKRMAGSYLRQALGVIPDSLVRRLKALRGGSGGPAYSSGEVDGFLGVTSCPQLFKGFWAPEWTPKIHLEQSIDDTISWLIAIGYGCHD